MHFRLAYLRVLPGLLAALLLGGCQLLSDQRTFQVRDSAQLMLPTAPGSMLPAVPVASTAAHTFAANHTSPDYVQDVTLDRLTLTLAEPAGRTFDFLKSIRVYISADAAGASKTLLTALNPVPAGQTVLALPPMGNKYDVYLKGSTYYLFVEAKSTQPVTLQADVRFNVHARPAR